MAAPPPDGHVHTEWSWDTTVGSMEQTCARAVDLGPSWARRPVSVPAGTRMTCGGALA
jgi:hypothetical protein